MQPLPVFGELASYTVKVRFNEVLRDVGNWFVISKICYIENLDITILRRTVTENSIDLSSVYDEKLYLCKNGHTLRSNAGLLIVAISGLWVTAK